MALAPDVELVPRGRAIAALSGATGHDVDPTLRGLHEDGAQPMLVRTWAAAARMQRCSDLASLTALAPLQNSFPALKRPNGLRLEALAAGGSARDLLRISAQGGPLQQAVGASLSAVPVDDLVGLVYDDADDTIRRQAAAWAANRAQTDGKASATSTTSGSPAPVTWAVSRCRARPSGWGTQPSVRGDNDRQRPETTRLRPSS